MKKEQNLKEMVLRDHYNALTEKQKTDLREKGTFRKRYVLYYFLL